MRNTERFIPLFTKKNKLKIIFIYKKGGYSNQASTVETYSNLKKYKSPPQWFA